MVGRNNNPLLASVQVAEVETERKGILLEVDIAIRELLRRTPIAATGTIGTPSFVIFKVGDARAMAEMQKAVVLSNIRVGKAWKIEVFKFATT